MWVGEEGGEGDFVEEHAAVRLAWFEVLFQFCRLGVALGYIAKAESVAIGYFVVEKIVEKRRIGCLVFYAYFQGEEDVFFDPDCFGATGGYGIGVDDGGVDVVVLGKIGECAVYDDQAIGGGWLRRW